MFDWFMLGSVVVGVLNHLSLVVGAEGIHFMLFLILRNDLIPVLYFLEDSAGKNEQEVERKHESANYNIHNYI